jgi:hypothetical protein
MLPHNADEFNATALYADAPTIREPSLPGSKMAPMKVAHSALHAPNRYPPNSKALA